MNPGRIVVVEDSPLTRRRMRGALQTEGHAASEAQLSVLGRLSDALATGAPLGDVLGEVLAGTLDVVALSAGALYLGARGRLTLGAHAGLTDPQGAAPEVFFGRPDLLTRVVTTGALVAVASPSAEVGPPSFVGLDVASALVLPLAARGERVGALLLCACDRDLTGTEFVAFARTVAAQIGLATSLAQTFGKVTESEQRLRLTLEGIHDYAILMLDPEGRVETWNAGAERMTGFGADEILGQRNARFFTAEGVAAGDPERELSVAAAQGRCEVEGWRVRKDGSRYWSHTVMTAMRDASGALRGFAKVSHDVTAQRRVEARLRMLESVVVNANDAVLLVETGPLGPPGDRIMYVNAAFSRMTGYAPDEVLGRDPNPLLLGPGTTAEARAQLRAALDRKAPARMDLLHYRKDGATFWVEVALSPVLDAGGAVTHWIALLRDTTERRQAEANALRLAREEAARTEAEGAKESHRYLAEASKLLASSLSHEEALRNIVAVAVPRLGDLCIVDLLEDGEIRRAAVSHADPARQGLADRLRTFTPSGHAGIRDALHTGRAVLIAEITDPLLASVAQSAEHLGVLRALAPTSAMIVPLVARGQVIGAISYMTTDRAVRYVAADLACAEDLAGRAALALENARLYEDAQRAVRVRDDLLAVVSHDLRSPLAAILLQAKLLACPPVLGEADGTGKKPVDSIIRAAEQMTALVSQLLDLGRLEAGRMALTLQPVDLRAVVADVLEALRPLADARAQRFEAALPEVALPVLADRDRVVQVLSNLVGNALKFTPNGGAITVCAGRTGAEVCVAVADTGPGIAPEHVAHLFDRYWQPPGTSRKGAGLGLFIVRGLVEAHGGRVWVESTPGVGSTFFFTLRSA